MEIEEESKEPISMPPKLLLSSQRFNRPELLFTSPTHNVVTVPFQWEEAPGKPRFTANDQISNSVRSLHLPPRMFNTNSKREFIMSPTTVLNGPDADTQSSCWVIGKTKWKIMKKIVGKETSRIKYSSWSWDGFTDISSRGGISGDTSFDDLSYSLDSKIKSNKVTKRRSFFLLDRTTSSILENMYEGINQVVPWRRY